MHYNRSLRTIATKLWRSLKCVKILEVQGCSQKLVKATKILKAQIIWCIVHWDVGGSMCKHISRFDFRQYFMTLDHLPFFWVVIYHKFLYRHNASCNSMNIHLPMWTNTHTLSKCEQTNVQLWSRVSNFLLLVQNSRQWNWHILLLVDICCMKHSVFLHHPISELGIFATRVTKKCLPHECGNGCSKMWSNPNPKTPILRDYKIISSS
jgi:hypothetical protein